MLQHKIDYPFTTDAYSADGRPLNLWAPTPIVEKAERMLPRGSRVVDIGAGRGANGMYLAMHGHEVISIEPDKEAIADGQKIARSLGIAVMSHLFVQADMREIDLDAEFGKLDAVLAIRSLQQVTKPQALRVVEGMQAVTKPSGLNVALAYIARPDQQQIMSHRTLFEPGQLDTEYQRAGWNVVMNQSQLHELEYINNQPLCRSTVDLVAAKPN